MPETSPATMASLRGSRSGDAFGRAPAIAATLAMVAGAALVYQLLAGGAFSSEAPAYSSVATEPGGTAALFGAYRRAGETVERGFQADDIGRQQAAATAAFVIAPDDWSDDLDAALDRFVRQGGWLVLVAPPWAVESASPMVASTAPPPLRAALGASVAIQDGPAPSGEAVAAELAAAVSDQLPADVPPLPVWQPRQTLVLSRDWTPLFRRNGHVYMAMRSYGAGTVVLASEPGFLSNDALPRSAPALLAWLTGGRANVFVDETGHGLEHARGVLWLVARHRLQAALLLLLAGLSLFAWTLCASLELPAAPPPPSAAVEAVESAQAGWVRLLERAVPTEHLLEQCWRQFARRQPRRAQQIEAAITAAQAGEAGALAVFNRIVDEAAKAAWSAAAGGVQKREPS